MITDLDEILPDLTETLFALFTAVESREPKSAVELGRWVQELGGAIRDARTLSTPAAPPDERE